MRGTPPPLPPVKNLLVFLVGRSTFGCCFSAALHCLPPLPLENSCLIKKVVAGCLAFENSSLGRRLLCCEHLFAIGALLRTTAFRCGPRKTVFEEWYKHFSEIER